MRVVSRAENSGKRWSFRSHTTHKGRPRAGMPQIASPTFSHPKRTCKETKMVRKKEREQKIDGTPAKPNRMNRRQKPPFYTTKVILEPFTHIRCRFQTNPVRWTLSARKTERRISKLLQIRECEALTNEICTKNGVKVKDNLGNGGKKREKGRRDDVVEEREWSPENRAGSRAKRTKSDPRFGSGNPNWTPSLRLAQNPRYPRPKHPTFTREPAHNRAAHHPRSARDPQATR